MPIDTSSSPISLSKRPIVRVPAPCCSSHTRRAFLIGVFAGSLIEPANASAAEVMDEATSLGVIDDTLGSCAGLHSCVSSYDDRPGFFASPWELSDQPEVAQRRLIEAVKKLGAAIIEEGKGSGNTRYLRASLGSQDVEFLLVSDGDRRIEVRAVSSREGFWDFGQNESLLEDIRALVGYPKLDVLRNRVRRLIFIESPWDTYGPAPPLGLTESLIGKKLIDWEDLSE